MVEDPGLPQIHGHPDSMIGGSAEVDHLVLLALGRRVQVAASRADSLRLLLAVQEFAESFERHLEGEARYLASMVPAQARILRRGHARISALVSQLSTESEGGRWPTGRGPGPGARDLLTLLKLQARDEWRAWGGPGGAIGLEARENGRGPYSSTS